MSSSHQSCNSSQRTRQAPASDEPRDKPVSAASLRAAPVPRRSTFLGSYFPSWLVCVGISIVLTFLAHCNHYSKKSCGWALASPGRLFLASLLSSVALFG